MAEYRYLTHDAQTGAVFTELPLSDVSLQRVINGAGAWSGTLKLSDPRAQAAFSETGCQPFRCGLAVLRDGTLVYGGMLWSRRYDIAAETVTFGGGEWFSALGRRKVRADQTWTSTAVETVVATLLSDMQGGTAGALGMTVTGTTGAVATGSVFTADRKWYGDVLLDLLKAGSIEVETYPAWSGNAIVPVLRLGAPTLGRALAASGLSVAEGLGGSWDEDGSSWLTQVVASSTGSGSAALVAQISNTTAMSAGYPRWEGEVSLDAADSATLTTRATDYLAARAPAAALSGVTARGTDPDVALIRLGDQAQVTFSPNARFPSGLVATTRITGWTLAPGPIDNLQLEIAS